jgi:hypothetical protein
MAGPGTVKNNYSFGDTFGGRFFNTVDYTGVAAYVAGTGELLSSAAFGFPNTIQFVWASGDQSGVYVGIPFPVNNGITQWYMRWFIASTGSTASLEVANGTNLSAKTLKLTAVGF